MMVEMTIIVRTTKIGYQLKKLNQQEESIENLKQHSHLESK